MIPPETMARLRTRGDQPAPMIPLSEVLPDPSPQLCVAADQAPPPVGPNRDVWRISVGAGHIEVGPSAEGHWVTSPTGAVFCGGDRAAEETAAALLASIQRRRADLQEQ